jgi:hypothetical protein
MGAPLWDGLPLKDGDQPPTGQSLPGPELLAMATPCMGVLHLWSGKSNLLSGRASGPGCGPGPVVTLKADFLTVIKNSWWLNLILMEGR